MTKSELYAGPFADELTLFLAALHAFAETAPTVEGLQVIDSAEFQRLRRIRQLGLAMFTYQGAEHSRFTHGLGVMHEAGLWARHLLARWSDGESSLLPGEPLLRGHAAAALES